MLFDEIFWYIFENHQKRLYKKIFQIFVLIIVIAFNEAESASVEKRNADPQVNLGDVLALSIPKRNLQFQRGQPVRNVVRAGARIRRVQAVSNIARTILSG